MSPERAYEWMSDDAARPATPPAVATTPTDADLLDAYSQAVIGVNKSVGPAVVSVQTSGRLPDGLNSACHCRKQVG